MVESILSGMATPRAYISCAIATLPLWNAYYSIHLLMVGQ